MLKQLHRTSQPKGMDFLKDIYGILAQYVEQRTDSDLPVQDVIRPDLLRKFIQFDNQEVLDREALKAVCEAVLKHSTQTQHPNFVSQLYGCPDPYGLAADAIVSALNTNVHIYDLAPVLTLVENTVIGYLSDKFLLSDGANKGDGIFVPGASTGTQYALHLARHLNAPAVKSSGMAQQKPLVAYCSEAAHYSCSNAAVLLGLGSENMRKIECDHNGAMLVDKLREALDQSIHAGEQPFCVIATAGTTVLGGFDPIEAIAALARRHDLWLHVDAAWGGAAAFSENHKQHLLGIHQADSVVFNAHKALGLPIQCSALLVNRTRGGILTEATSTRAPYLHQSDRVTHEENLDISKKTFQCGRKGDALKLWLLKQAVGDAGLAERVDCCAGVAAKLAKKVQERTEADGSFILKSNIFATTCFWYIPRKFRGSTDGSNMGKLPFDLGSIAPKIKEYMLANGYNCMLGYASSANTPAFFRWAVTNPPAEQDFSEQGIDRILDMIEDVGERISGAQF